MGFLPSRRAAPRRGISAVLLSALALPFLTGAIVAPPSLECRLLLAHNAARRELGLPPLRWDPALAADADRWGRHLARIGHLAHSPASDPEGENLWSGTRGAYSPEQIIALWVGEKRNYVPGRFPDVSRTGDVMDVAHYTQIIWRATTAMGCALASGERDQFLTCRYAEGGNVVGERPY